MDELWALLNFTAQGMLLGTIRHFNNHIASKIVAARDRHASAGDLQDGNFASELLARMIAPYVLRREKTSLLSATGAGANAASSVASGRQLSKKTEVVLWVSMSAPQVWL
jgi:SNF2 family DNA or RNA helicase